MTTARTAEVTNAIADVFAKLPVRRDALGIDYLMEPDDAVVIRIGELKIKDGPRLRIGATEASARPPFEWFYEVTSDITPAEYFKHYLVLEDQIVLAQLKVLTPIDEAEAELILSDLATAVELIESSSN